MQFLIRIEISIVSIENYQISIIIIILQISANDCRISPENGVVLIKK